MKTLYKIETHLHTNIVSCCGKLSPEEILAGYSRAGYHGIVVTDHFMEYTFQWLKISSCSNEEKWNAFCRSYDILCGLAPDYGIRVYFGAEVRFDDTSSNDYLVYGCPPELLMDMERVFTCGLEDFYPRCHAAGGLIIQAHPNRGQCFPSDPRYLDGVEVYNLHPRHDSRNELTAAFAEQNPHLIRLSGSDCHQAPDIGRGGILTQTLPADERELVEIIKKGKFTCIVPE